MFRICFLSFVLVSIFKVQSSKFKGPRLPCYPKIPQFPLLLIFDVLAKELGKKPRLLHDQFSNIAT